jgi:hypothetical protein
MSSTQTDMRVPPLRDTSLDKVIQQWLLAMAKHQPLITVDTTAGNEIEDLPPAGLSNSATGETNLNVDISYVKTSADANTVTINGAASGAVILAAQFDHATFKSDGTDWYRVA